MLIMLTILFAADCAFNYDCGSDQTCDLVESFDYGYEPMLCNSTSIL